jgi:hypothetical protein
MSRSNFELVDLASIERRARELANRIGAPDGTLPVFGRNPLGDGTSVQRTDAYHYIIEERGLERERRTTTDIDELLYWIFSSATFSMACDWELRHRCEGEDFRRRLFAKQEELLGGLSPEWAAREANRHRDILRRHPFRDG